MEKQTCRNQVTWKIEKAHTVAHAWHQIIAVNNPKLAGKFFGSKPLHGNSAGKLNESSFFSKRWDMAKL